ncbi:serine hydrolase domain-containing protein [Acidicapsa acidisoli]|uniref:serine hydrolase domain-containing protein n=1 Tax=Acidicapsa acidisoli TaxID=1615681 RepID=UPI0021DFFF3C|nr:serine hydrolase domain-containing protein [Acidicapsa acidisoli]
MRKFRLVLPCLLTVAGLSLAANAQTVDGIEPSLRAQIDRIASQVLEQRGIPSASVAVVQGGKVVYTHAYGLAHIAPDVPATPEMRYSIGSVSKQFTAAAILLLQEQGKLSLDDAVGKYVPGLTRGDEVTIRQILSHTSGYQDYWPEDYLMTPMMKPGSAQQILDTWAKKPLDFEPGTKWQYSNTNYVIAGEIVEKVSGEKLFAFLGEHIFHPLGMKSVWDSDETKLTSTDATPYVRNALGPMRLAPKEGTGWMFAAGELAMTAHDLALWDESLIAQSVLKPESYKEMFTEVKLKDGSGTEYGLGVGVKKRDGHRSIEHSGEVTGFVSDNEVLVDDGVAVAVLTNHMAGGAEEIAQLVASTVAGSGKQSDSEKQALAIYRDLQQGKIDRSLLSPNLNDYFSEQTIADFKNSLGPLGEPLTFKQAAEELRGGMTLHVFRIVYPGKRLTLTTYTYPDGKLEQYLVEPGN